MLIKLQSLYVDSLIKKNLILDYYINQLLHYKYNKTIINFLFNSLFAAVILKSRRGKNKYQFIKTDLTATSISLGQ